MLVKNKYFQAEEAIVNLRDPRVAYEVLEGKLCVCCKNAAICPHENPPPGICQKYELEEKNPLQTERKVMQVLLGYS